MARDSFKIILEQDRGYWRWRVISPWNFTSAGSQDTRRGAYREAKRAMRRLDNIRSMTVDSGNEPTYEPVQIDGPDASNGAI